MKHLRTGLLLTSAAFALPVYNANAEPPSAVQSTPLLNERGELTIKLMNWSKLEMEVSGISASLGISNDDTCKWSLVKPVRIAATQEETIVVADAARVTKCLRTRKVDVPFYSLQFSSLTPDADKTESKTEPVDMVLTVAIDITHRDRVLKNSSAWLLAQSAQ